MTEIKAAEIRNTKGNFLMRGEADFKAGFSLRIEEAGEKYEQGKINGYLAALSSATASAHCWFLRNP